MTVNSLVLNLFITFAASSAASYYTAAGFIEQIPIVLFAKNLSNQLAVGFYHSLRINGREVDLRGFQAFMPQALADNGKADTQVPHRAGPAMPPDIRRKRNLQSHHAADSLQQPVHLMFHPFVLPPFRAVLLGDDGQ